MPTDSFIPTRPSLLARLKDANEQAAWQEFLDTYGRLIRGAALKSRLTEAEADDVLQDTALAVVKNIGEFQYDPAKCSFKSWLLLITRQRIIWQLRKRLPSASASARSEDDGPRTATIDRIPDPAVADLDGHWEEEWQKNLMATALAKIKRKVKAKQFQIFDLYALQQWPAREVARTLKVSVAQVYLAKHRVSATLKRELKKLAQELPKS